MTFKELFTDFIAGIPSREKSGVVIGFISTVRLKFMQKMERLLIS
jgi:hypothetical protein